VREEPAIHEEHEIDPDPDRDIDLDESKPQHSAAPAAVGASSGER
jgi:hypothetical protein